MHSQRLGAGLLHVQHIQTCIIGEGCMIEFGLDSTWIGLFLHHTTVIT